MQCRQNTNIILMNNKCQTNWRVHTSWVGFVWLGIGLIQVHSQALHKVYKEIQYLLLYSISFTMFRCICISRSIITLHESILSMEWAGLDTNMSLNTDVMLIWLKKNFVLHTFQSNVKLRWQEWAARPPQPHIRHLDRTVAWDQAEPAHAYQHTYIEVHSFLQVP